MSREEPRLPGIGDFAPKAVRRAIRNESLTHPATIYPGVAGILGGVAWALFGSPVLLGAAFGALLIGLTSMTVNYFFRDNAIAERYVEHLKKQMAEREERLLKDLKQNLAQCRDIPGAKHYATQGLEQFTKIRKKYDNLNNLVEQKLGSGELALGGVWAAMEQVYLGVLENLKSIVTALQSISTIDPRYIRNRLRWLAALDHPTEADRREVETLRERERLRTEQLEKVNEFLTRNEEALTRLEETTVTISAIRSDEEFTTVQTDDSVERLRQLARQIHERQSGLGA